MIQVGIIGVTGYTGAELIRILYSHPKVNIKKVASRSNKGYQVSENHKHFFKTLNIIDDGLDNPEEFAKDLDVVFLALPHGTASEIVAKLKGKVKIIDLSADFRLKDLGIYEKWYGVKHSCPNYFKDAVYGLPEIYREKIKNTDLVANPGCYPTSIILGLYPLLKNKMFAEGTIIADSKSGVSGAGKKTADHTHFPEINENFYAYNLGRHRHTPEIKQELIEASGGGNLQLIFSPHLVPMTRGILSTVYVDLKEDYSLEEIYKVYEESYDKEFFVRFRKDLLPQTKLVSGSNFCDIGLVKAEEGRKLIIVSVIDNLVKGASGQAVQNMNLMFGLEEKIGLDFLPVYP